MCIHPFTAFLAAILNFVVPMNQLLVSLSYMKQHIMLDISVKFQNCGIIWTILRYLTLNRSTTKAKTLSKPEPVQTGIKVCPQGIPVWTGFTAHHYFMVYVNHTLMLYVCKLNELFLLFTPKVFVLKHVTYISLLCTYIIILWYMSFVSTI